jgi:iron(III) transport system substrate-binding protein
MNWLPRIVVLVLLAVTLVIPFLLAPPEARPPADALELVVISPHSESIKFEFARAFDAWHREHFGRPVRIDYRDIGGSSEISRFLDSEYKALAAAGGKGRVGIDVIWGGGAFDFANTYAEQGFLSPYPLAELEADLGEKLSDVIPRTPPAMVKLDSAYQSYDKLGRWYGACLSSFGIVYNRNLCRTLGLPEPGRWIDLAGERFFTQVGLGDPTQSGSIAKCYFTVAASYKWDEAMRILTRMGANARYFTNSASRVPQDVGLPDIAAGVAIDYYARSQASVYDDGRLEFKPAEDGPAIDADPIGILRGTAREELARQFVRFVLSKPGQRLWAYKKGEPGGPTRYEIRRPPIRTDLYTPEEMAHFRDAEDIYKVAEDAAARATPTGFSGRYFGIFRVLVRHMIIEPHPELVEAWQAVIAHGKDRPELVAAFDEVVVTEAELTSPETKAAFKDPLKQVQLRNDWTRRFIAKYKRVIAMAAELR